MKRVGIIGGTFDPIHEGHVSLAKQAYEQLNLDEIWFLPVLNNPFTKNIHASNEDRVKMIELATKNYPYMKIEDYELKQDPKIKSYTYNTMVELSKRDIEIYFIIGMDQAEQFQKWYEADKLSELVHLCVFDRKGYKRSSNIEKYHMNYLVIKPMKASSSAIREGKVKYLCDDVLKYCIDHFIYIPEIVHSYMSDKRFNHTMGVVALAEELASSNGVDVTKARVAALFHDIAKEMDDVKATAVMEKYYKEHMDASKPVWHQWLSSYLIQRKFRMHDTEILQAIENHTTASTNMSKLDMVIYCADKYDRTRGFNSEPMINVCKKNIEQGFKEALIDFVNFSNSKGRSIDASFFEIYKKYVGE